ncbi:probable F-box protein At5g04010 [Trifolium pratense]|uniref:probable F-box protein At5g04010 n=1 Tax=Trifolium pratense TaxID=57577 RepID=UPI001E692F51|nr:probable F-box protein At5g04010 [Trifolium pratense]
MKKMVETHSHSTTLSWEILILIAHYLDPKTLAIASCVSKSWLHSMSSDLLWKPILTTHFPSLSTLPSNVSYCRLFALGHGAAKRRRQSPSKPTLSLGDLIFAVSITSNRDSRTIGEFSWPVDALQEDPPGVFRFCIGFDCGGGVAVRNEGLEEVVKVTWNVVVKGWRGVFTLMDYVGKMGFVGGGEEWFSQELPAPGCCSKVVASSVVADMRVGMCGCGESDDGGGKVRVGKISVGILNVDDWRYVGIEDGLRYLQHFLLT